MIKYKVINRSDFCPVDIVLVDRKDIEKEGISIEEGIKLISLSSKEPMAINVFDMDAITTTSDGIMIEGAIVTMASSDNSIIHPEFGMLSMKKIVIDDRLIELEPHLIQYKNYEGRDLYRGPDPKEKIIPVHNVTITGRVANNNSATEMMNIVTMEEMLFPIMGQLSIMKGEDVLVGKTGGVISVGIGMTVAEEYGRVFPTRQFKAGQTAHNSGIYAKTLKKDIPCIVATKETLAKNIIMALDSKVIPGKTIGCSPAVLRIAKYYGSYIDVDNIEDGAWIELESVGILKKWIESDMESYTKDEIIKRADKIIPGVVNPVRYNASEIAVEKSLKV
jgi:hypothetical protein